MQGSTINRVFIPATEAEARIEVVPVADNLTESSVVRLELVAGTDYALGPDPAKDVLIYDGPEWTITELSDARLVGGQWQYPTATYATSIGSGSPIRVGGRVVYPAQSGVPAVDLGGFWTGGGGNISDLWGVRNVGGVGAAPLGISDGGRTVGEAVVPMPFLFNFGAGVTWLGDGWGAGGGALGISPNGNRIVGRGNLLNTPPEYSKHPLVWRETSIPGVFMVPMDLSQSLLGLRGGEARAVNTLGLIVGQVTTFYQGQFLPRGFLSRTETSGASTPLAEPQDVLLPSSSNPAVTTTAIGISSPIVVTGSGKGYAAGHQLVGGLTEGAFWWPRSESGPNSGQLSPAVALGRWKDPVSDALDPESAASGVNSSQMVVGWSGTPSNKRATIKKGAGALWVNLNDKHLVHGMSDPPPSGWNLQEAIAINEQGSIVGNGTKGGSSTPRAFLLIRRSDEN